MNARMHTHRLGRRGSKWILAVLASAALVAGCSSPQSSEVVASGEYAFWPPLPDEPRIQFLTSYRFSSDIEPPQSGLDKLVFGKDQVILPIGKPYGVAIWNGRIYVCDVTNPGVMILDLKNRRTQLMGVSGSDHLAQPVDIAIAPDGMKYVVDRRLKRIFVFDANDRHVASFSPDDTTPVGVAVRGTDIVVADFETQSVLVLDRFTGELKGSVGVAGGGDGGFIRPLGIEADASGDIFVTDVIQGTLQRFDSDGELVYRVGQIADSAGNFVRPKHLAVDEQGVIYVVDAAFQNVQMFDDEGTVLMFFGSPGPHPGAMSLPAGITITSDNLDLFEEYVHPAFEPRQLILVTNQFGVQKVSVYAMGSLKPGRTVADIAPHAATVASGLWSEEEAAAAAEAASIEGGEATLLRDKAKETASESEDDPQSGDVP